MKQTLEKHITPKKISLGLLTVVSPVIGGFLIGAFNVKGRHPNSRVPETELAGIYPLGGAIAQYSLLSLYENKFISSHSIDTFQEVLLNPYISHGIESISKLM